MGFTNVYGPQGGIADRPNFRKAYPAATVTERLPGIPEPVWLHPTASVSLALVGKDLAELEMERLLLFLQ